MKKLFFLLVTLVTVVNLNAERCSVLKVGKYWENRCEFVSMTDTTVTLIEGQDSIATTYFAWEISELYLPLSKQRYSSFKGKFYSYDELEEARAQEYEAYRRQRDLMKANNPNYAVGQAMRSVAKGSLIVGIPSLIAGTILLGYGEGMLNKKPTSKDIKKYSDCATAGMILFPIGASLTIVGIPLSIEGKELMRLNINYTGNGAGLSLEW